MAQELDQEMMKMLIEQMGKGGTDKSKAVGSQSMGKGIFAPAKTDMGPVDDIAGAVGQINPVAGAASQALLGGVEGLSGMLGMPLAVPGRVASGLGRAIQGLRPFPGKNEGASKPSSFAGLAGMAPGIVQGMGSKPPDGNADPPPGLDARRMDSPDWKPSAESNRIGIAAALSPGAAMSQWSGEINAGQPDFDRDAESKRLGAIVGEPSGMEAKKPPPQWSQESEDLLQRGRDVAAGTAPPSFEAHAAEADYRKMSDEERRRKQLMNQYNPYARRGINPG